MTIPPVTDQPGGDLPTPPRPQQSEEPVAAYMAPAVFITLLCCLPAGLVAIYFSSQVSSLQAVGNRIAAVQASDKARLWCWIGGLLGLVWPFIILGLIVAGGVGLLECFDSFGINFD